MYRQGWDERNGGNVSVLLDEEQVKEYLDTDKVLRVIPTGFDAKELVGKYFIVTGTGKYFKNVEGDPETNLGIIHERTSRTPYDTRNSFENRSQPQSGYAHAPDVYDLYVRCCKNR